MADHALGEESGEGLIDVEIAAAPQRAGKEAGIEEVQHRMLDAADILVDRQPVIGGCPGKRLVALRRAEAGEIPGRLDEGVEGVRLAPRRLAPGRTGDIDRKSVG